MQYYEINEQTARRANDVNSMSDYRPGSATEEYRAAVDKAAALVQARKAKISPYYHDKLDALLDRYARRLAEWTNDYNRNQASYPSQFISGAGGYNMRKHEKQMSREGTLWNEYDEIKAILNKIEAVGSGPVDLAGRHLEYRRQQQRLLLHSRGTAGESEEHRPHSPPQQPGQHADVRRTRRVARQKRPDRHGHQCDHLLQLELRPGKPLNNTGDSPLNTKGTESK